MLPLHSLTRDGQWPQQSTLMYQALDRDGVPPLTCQEEVVGLIGNGTVGKYTSPFALFITPVQFVPGSSDRVQGKGLPNLHEAWA